MKKSWNNSKGLGFVCLSMGSLSPESEAENVVGQAIMPQFEAWAGGVWRGKDHAHGCAWR